MSRSSCSQSWRNLTKQPLNNPVRARRRPRIGVRDMLCGRLRPGLGKSGLAMIEYYCPNERTQNASRMWLLLAALTLLSGCAGHGVYDSYSSDEYVYADVVAATPVYGPVQVPEVRQVCREEQVTYKRRANPAGAIFGALIGAGIGNAIDGGYRRTAGTLIGAAAGGAIGQGIASEAAGPGRSEVYEVCDDITEYRTERGVTGYEVTYDYQGYQNQLYMEYNPGNQVRVPLAQLDPQAQPRGVYEGSYRRPAY